MYMNRFRASEDIISLSELRANLGERIDGLSLEGSDYFIVTRNGRAAAVVLAPEHFDRLRYESFVRGKIASGLADAASGELHDHDSVMQDAMKVVRGEQEEG